MPEIDVFQDATSELIQDGDSIVMPATDVGESKSLRFRITNTGTDTLTITNPSSFVSGSEFSLAETPASTVAPGRTTYFRVRLLSATAGTKTGLVKIQNNDSGEDPYNITLVGAVGLHAR